MTILMRCTLSRTQTCFAARFLSFMLAVMLTGCQSIAVDSKAMRLEVAVAHARLAASFSSCNEAGFVAAYADEFVFTTSNTPQGVTTPAGLRAYLGYGCKLNPTPTAAVKTESIRFVGSQAIVTGQYLFRVPANGKVIDVVQNFMAVFIRQPAEWKVTAHHVSLVP